MALPPLVLVIAYCLLLVVGKQCVGYVVSLDGEMADHR